MKVRNLVIAVSGVLLFVLLSLPYQWAFTYWAETQLAWIASFVVGIIVAVYSLLVFLRAWERLTSEGEDSAEVHG